MLVPDRGTRPPLRRDKNVGRSEWRDEGLARGRGPRCGVVAACVVLALLGVPGVATAQSTPPDDTRFQKVLLDGPLTQPMRLAVAPDGRVIYIGRTGDVKVWSPQTQATTLAGSVPTAVVGETGLIGLALAPDFGQTGHLYLNYALPDYRQSFIARVSRFTLGADNTLDLVSEVPTIDVQHPIGYLFGHDAGDLVMTPDGLLFISTGDNTNCCRSRGFPGLDERPGQEFGDAQRTASNTNSLIGKILRIRPLPEGGYAIPDGNLFPESQDPGDKTRPEIYAMGFRNPFAMGGYDAATGALWMGDYGPDAVLPDPQRGPAGHVKLHLITEPGFYGWPYCTMNNVPYNHWNYVTDSPGEFFDCDNPVNNSPNNTGLVNLPPAQPAQIYYTYSPSSYFPELYGGGAHAGPQYHYDAANPSTTKFPEWFDGRWFFFDWTQSWIQTTRLAADKTPVDMQQFLRGMEFNQPMDMQFGPDGSLYVMEYGTGWGATNDDSGIYRIDYATGNRTPAVRATSSVNSGALPLTVEFDASASSDPDGDALSFSWDFDGDGNADATGATASHTYTTPGQFAARVTVTDANGASAVANLSIVAGNTRPTVIFETPVDGTFSEFGAPIPVKLHVSDPEDGAAADCRNMKVTYSLGHNEHAHPQGEASVGANCEGVFVPSPDAGHDPGFSYVYHVLQATYTDSGGVGNTPALTGEAGVVLHPHKYAARTYREGKGVGLYFGELFVPGSGDWFMFPRIDVQDIKALKMQIWQNGTGATMTVHAGSPTGPVVATFSGIPDMGPEKDQFGRPDAYGEFTASVSDPGGVNNLYFVVDWPAGTAPEIFVFLTNRPPDCSGLAASKTTLWPPNHKFVTVSVSGATDPDGDPIITSITSVTQDEPLDGVSDGSTTPDATRVAARPDQVRLRAERSDAGDGRVYRIGVSVSDGADTCTDTVVVGVPLDRTGPPPVDSGLVVDSFGP